MKLPRRNFLRLAAGAAALPAVSRIAWAQAYPTRPVRVIVGFPAGGPLDMLARLMGQWLSERLGQQFVIENRPGAATNIATEAVARARPDGYTILMASTTNTINATLYDKLNFNFIRDIAPVAGVIRGSLVMVVTRLDRLARSTRDLLNVLDELGKRGIGFKSLKDAWADTTTPHGKLMVTILGGLAEFERELIRARTGEGRKRAKERGVKFGRPRKMTPHQRQEALQRLHAGETMADVARTYNVDATTIGRLAGSSPFEHGAVAL